MAKRDLIIALDSILDETRGSKGFKQSDDNVTSTQILGSNVREIIVSLYKGLTGADLGKVNELAPGNRAIRPSDITLQKRISTTAMTKGLDDAVRVYMDSTVKSITSIGKQNIFIGTNNIPTEVTWTYIGEGSGKRPKAGSLDTKINRKAMRDLSKWVDNNWEEIEKETLKELGKGNKSRLFARGVSDSEGFKVTSGLLGKKETTSGALGSYSVFGHGVPGGGSGGKDYASTYYAVRILSQLIGKGGKAELDPNNTNPILKQFQTDLLHLFEVEGSIDVQEASTGSQMGLLDSHKEFIHIKGQIIPKKRQSDMASWDKGGQDITRATKGIEKRLLDVLTNSYNKMAEKIQKGDKQFAGKSIGDLGRSPSTKTKIGRKAVHTTLRKLRKTNPGAVIKAKTPKPKRSPKKAPVKKKKPLKKGARKPGKTTTNRAKAPKGKRKATSARKARADTGATRNPLALKGLLQKSLPDEVAAKMTGGSTLHWRTGRFSDSPEIVNVVPYPRSLEVQYTYMKDPYQVFEPGSGSPLATRGRDPQRIIGSTIRELAQGIMGDRFMVRTKRV